MSVARNISWSAGTLPDGTAYAAGTIIADAVVEERSDDSSIITENPVENGSVTSDHAYDNPAELELTYVWAPGGKQNKQRDPSFLNGIYQQLLSLRATKALFSVVTGKRQYKNMLFKNLSSTTDEKSENILMIRMACKELLLTITQTVTLSNSAQQSLPQKTSSPINQGNVSLGPGSNFNPGTPTGS